MTSLITVLTKGFRVLRNSPIFYVYLALLLLSVVWIKKSLVIMSNELLLLLNLLEGDQT